MNRRRVRFEQLLADRATGDLTPAAQAELQQILSDYPEWEDQSFELAAAALIVAMAEELEAMPDEVRQRLCRRFHPPTAH